MEVAVKMLDTDPKCKEFRVRALRAVGALPIAPLLLQRLQAASGSP